MGKYVTLLLGVAAMAGGIVTIHATWPLFWRAVQAVVPALIVFVGMMAVLVGLGEIRDSLERADRKTEKPKN
jgi:hypothetical protein